MIAVDASLIGAFILKGEGWEDYAGMLENALTIDHAIKEVSNAIWKAFMEGHIELNDVKTKLEAPKKLSLKNLTIFPEMELLDQAIEIALSHRLSVYDSLYIALANAEKTSFSSLDKTHRGVHNLNFAECLGLEFLSYLPPRSGRIDKTEYRILFVKLNASSTGIVAMLSWLMGRPCLPRRDEGPESLSWSSSIGETRNMLKYY